MKDVETKKRMQLFLLIDRILAVMTVIGLICVVVGLPLYLVSRTVNDLTVSRAGAYILLIGVALLAMRIFYWIAEEIVGRGLESMAKQDSTALLPQ